MTHIHLFLISIIYGSFKHGILINNHETNNWSGFVGDISDLINEGHCPITKISSENKIVFIEI